MNWVSNLGSMASPTTDINRKRPCVRNIALCGNVTVDGNNVIKNTIYEYSEDDTWRDVFDDLCDGQGGGDLSLGKADTIDEVCLTHKLTSADVFHPDLEEPIKVALNFDKHLKYVTFKVKKFHHTDENSNHEKPKTRKSTYWGIKCFSFLWFWCSNFIQIQSTAAGSHRDKLNLDLP